MTVWFVRRILWIATLEFCSFTLVISISFGETIGGASIRLFSAPVLKPGGCTSPTLDAELVVLALLPRVVERHRLLHILPS